MYQAVISSWERNREKGTMGSYEKSIPEDFKTRHWKTNEIGQSGKFMAYIYCIMYVLKSLKTWFKQMLQWHNIEANVLWWISMCAVTLLWAYTTEPSSFQVPPRRSMRTMRKICRNRMLRRADVAKIFPCVPAAITASDATKTMKSTKWEKHRWQEQKTEGGKQRQ